MISNLFPDCSICEYHASIPTNVTLVPLTCESWDYYICYGLIHNENLFICEVLGDIVARRGGRTPYCDLAGLVLERYHDDSRESC